MVTLKCTKEECVSQNIEFNFLGNPEIVICGGCKKVLIATDLRDDPEESHEIPLFG